MLLMHVEDLPRLKRGAGFVDSILVIEKVVLENRDSKSRARQVGTICVRGIRYCPRERHEYGVLITDLSLALTPSQVLKPSKDRWRQTRNCQSIQRRRSRELASDAC